MAAIDSNTLFDETKCYACLGITMAQLLELGLLRRTLLARSPSADVTMQGLMTYATCYGCYGASNFELLKLAMLDLISQS